jgi:hypothetical protein
MDTLPLNVIYKKLGIPYQNVTAQQEELTEKVQDIAERAELLYGALSDKIDSTINTSWISVEAPNSSESTGTPKTFALDEYFFYVCGQDGKWKRIPYQSI